MSARSRQLSVYLVVFCLALAACGGDGDDDADPQPTTTSPSTTQSPEAQDEQSLRQLAEDWYEVSRQAYLEDGFDLTEIEGYLADPYLEGFVAQVEAYRADGKQSQRGEASRHVVEGLQVDGDAATVTECIVDGEVLLDADGEVLNDSVMTTRVRTEAVRTDGGWRFKDREVVDDEQEGDACAE